MRYCKVVSCEYYTGTNDVSIQMFRTPTKDNDWLQLWNTALENVKCTGGNLICIKHFETDKLVIKSKKYALKRLAVPSIFPVPETNDEPTKENEAITADCAKCNNAEIEIRFLRSCMNGIEKEKECIEKQLQMVIDSQSEEIRYLKEKVNLLGAENARYDTKFAQFAVDSDPKVQKEKQILSCLALGVGHRQVYPPAVRNFAISLKNISPAAYRFVRSEFNNNLPHSITITDWHANSDINCDHGIIAQSLNILRKKNTEMAEKGEKLIGALLFDEMSIKTHIQWAKDKMLGFEYIPGTEKSKADVASEVLVYMFSGINNELRLPVAYYFVTKKLDALKKMDITKMVIVALLECNVDIECLTFDGLKTNPAMCKSLGANLDVYSDNFNPTFEYNGKHIRVMYDFSHVIKLIRNSLGSKKVLFDADNNEIKWKYFEKLVEFKDQRNFALCHKMTRAHIEYNANPMKVILAVQTLSASTARSMEFLMNQGHQEFANAEATIKFIRIINDLFDVFNSTDNAKENPLKNQMSAKNAEQIFKLFDEARKYIKGLQVIEDGRKIKICKSSIKTGFEGFVIDMQSLTEIYNKLVVETKVMESIATHSMSQDHLEMFFGQMRALHGFNNNPIPSHFTAGIRKILAKTTIICSEHANCSDLGLRSDYNPYSNIWMVSSRRATNNSSLATNENVDKDELDAFMDQLAEIQRLERGSAHTDLGDLTVAYIAGMIDLQIQKSNRFSCELCKAVLSNGAKIHQAFLASSQTIKPCQSTFDVCTTTDHFLKIELLKGQFNMATIKQAIITSLDFENLYDDADFLNHADHKLYMIKYILAEYIRVKGVHLARTYNFKTNQKLLRQKLAKLILNQNQ